MMQSNELVTLSRDCDAILIPVGTRITLPAGQQVVITQALGGSYTVYVEGNLARIAAEDADALGKRSVEQAVAAHTGGPVDEQQVWDKLRTCYDPEIPINIVELGLIYECKIVSLPDGGNRVDIKMTLTAPGCGMGVFLQQDVINKVRTVPNVTDVNVEIVFDPPWNHSMMSEAAKLQSGML
jgi:probable FeS assembly SUF system protein SufT